MRPGEALLSQQHFGCNEFELREFPVCVKSGEVVLFPHLSETWLYALRDKTGFLALRFIGLRRERVPFATD